MEKLSQEYILSIVFRHCIEREELLMKKYQVYFESIKDQELKDTLKEFNRNAQQHIKLMKDKMIKLNIQG